MADLPEVRQGHAPALPGSDLASIVRQKLLDDLGQVQVDRIGQQRIYRPRAELLAEAVTPETWVVVLDWISSTRRGSLQTKRNYADDLRTVWAPYAQELGADRFSLGIFTSDHIRAWRIRQEAQGAPPTTMARRLNVLSSLHKYAAQKMDLPRNPVTEDDRPQVDKGNTSTSTPVLEVEEIRALLAQAQDQRDRLVVQLLYTLAGRVSEMCAANVDKLLIRKGRLCIDLTRKEHKDRILPLPAVVADLLTEHIGGRIDGPLLLDAEGKRLDRHDVARMLTRMGHHARLLTCSDVDTKRPHSFAKCKRCRDVTPHVLRASRITHMLDADTSLAEVQAFADHDNPATTVAYWARRNKAERNAAHVDQAAALLADLDGVPGKESSL